MRFPLWVQKVATDKSFGEMLAGIPQRGKTTFWCSRDSRNEEKLLFELCGIPATRKKCFLGFAGFPQRGKTAFWALRDSRKHFPKRFWPFGSCCRPSIGLIYPSNTRWIKGFPCRKGRIRNGLGKIIAIHNASSSLFFPPFREHYPHPRAFVSCIKL